MNLPSSKGFTLPRSPAYFSSLMANQRDHDHNDLDPVMLNVAKEAPRVYWDDFLKRFNWKVGEHIGLIGPTGQGKTTLLLQLLPLHKYVVVMATKPKDSSMMNLVKNRGYLLMERWRSLDPEDYPKRLLWPPANTVDSDDIQRQVFGDALARIYREGGWTVAIDETWWFDNVLKLGKYIRIYLLQARSLGISLICGTQRPAWVPRELYTSATHLFFWRTNDETDLNSLSGIGFRSGRLIREIVANLETYQALYINTRTGQMMRTRVPANRKNG